jgi:hypothetical protein
VLSSNSERELAMGIGIDYGMGRTNRDPDNGIRYGVISQHSVGQAWYDEAEADYGKPTCPKCGNEVVDSCCVESENENPETGEFEETFTQLYSHGCQDYACDDCKLYLDSSDCYGDEPMGWSYDGDGYSLTSCLDSDIMVLKSPFYTRVQFCSPCVPGAGDLDSPDDDGAATYCLGHDWFEEGIAPYPVFSVATNELVQLPQQHGAASS